MSSIRSNFPVLFWLGHSRHARKIQGSAHSCKATGVVIGRAAQHSSCKATSIDVGRIAQHKLYGHVCRWALGILLFELTAGVTPFVGDDKLKMFKKACHRDLVWPKHLSKESGFPDSDSLHSDASDDALLLLQDQHVFVLDKKSACASSMHRHGVFCLS